MAASLITFQRDNLIQDPSYGLVTSWDALMEDAAAEIDQVMAATAWEKALRDAYVYQDVYSIMFLVLDRREPREFLLIKERPRVQTWHEQLADIIATVMHEHGQSTPRYEAMARRAARGFSLVRIWRRWAPRQGKAKQGLELSTGDEAGNTRPNKGGQPPCATCIRGVGVTEACPQRRLFDPYAACEADQGTEDRNEETQPTA
jgi:hypothetical protein